MSDYRYVENPDLVMKCDMSPCNRQVKYAPCIHIPATVQVLTHRPFPIMTTLHFCDHHKDAFNAISAQVYLSDAIKARAERAIKIKRPWSFKPDFDKATVEMKLVTTPEYRNFLERIGARRVVTG